MSDFIGDLTGIVSGTMGSRTPVHNTKQNSVDLDMTSFLQLMIVQLQNQTIDNTMDTSDMLNQMVQMQMVTAMANMTDASVMSYASSLVGKEVTILQYNGSQVVEKVIEVYGTGTYGGQQVIFDKDGNMYALNEIMAVGRIPEAKDEEDDSVGEGGDIGEGDGEDNGIGEGDGEDDTTIPDVGDAGSDSMLDDLLDAVDKIQDDIQDAIDEVDEAGETEQPDDMPPQKIQDQTASVTDRPVDGSSAEIEDAPSQDGGDDKVEGVAGTEGV